MKKSIKNEMKTRIISGADSDLKLTIYFTEETYKSIDWVEENEFRLNGKMYDIISEKQNDDGSIILCCFEDNKETWLFNELKKQSNENSAGSDKHKNMQKLLKIFTTTYTLPESDDLSTETFSVILNSYFSEHYTSIHLSKHTPPPKNIC